MFSKNKQFEKYNFSQFDLVLQPSSSPAARYFTIIQDEKEGWDDLFVTGF